MSVSTRSLERKQADSYARIAQNVLGTSLTAAVPTPALELTKALAISLADAWMFYDIYRIYYDERLSSQRLQDLLGDAGVIIMTGGVISYGALKISQGMMSEFLNKIPVVGWVASGFLTGSSSLLLGLAWMAFIESQYRQAIELDKRPAKKTPSADKATAPEPVEETTEADLSQVLDYGLPEIELDLDDEGKYLPQHPEDKRTLRVDGNKYQAIYQALRESLMMGEDYALEDITERLEQSLKDRFEGSVRWHVNAVKLDLEARGLIERIPDVQPQRIRITPS